jgi:hypothetical protein
MLPGRSATISASVIVKEKGTKIQSESPATSGSPCVPQKRFDGVDLVGRSPAPIPEEIGERAEPDVQQLDQLLHRRLAVVNPEPAPPSEGHG